MSDVTHSTVAIPDGWPGDTVARLAALIHSALPTPDQIDVPIIAPAMLLAQPAVATHLAALHAPAGTCAVHESQKFQISPSRDLSQGRALTIDVHRSERVARIAVDLHGAQGLGGATMEARVRFVDAADVAAVTAPKVQDRLLASAAQPLLETQHLDQNLVAQYVAMSGDTNPIHVSNGAARKAGFAGAVVPGMLICGVSERAAMACCPDICAHDMSTRFLSAAPVGQRLRFVTTLRAPQPAAGGGLMRVVAISEDDAIVAISDVRGLGAGAQP